MKDRLYRVSITVESKDQFEGKVKGWTRNSRYVGTDNHDQPSMLYYHDYEAFIREKNEDEVKQFSKKEVDKLKRKGYSVEKIHLTIMEVKETRGRKISVEPLEQKVNS